MKIRESKIHMELHLGSLCLCVCLFQDYALSSWAEMPLENALSVHRKDMVNKLFGQKETMDELLRRCSCNMRISTLEFCALGLHAQDVLDN